jgi:hypothetical protein
MNIVDMIRQEADFSSLELRFQHLLGKTEKSRGKTVNILKEILPGYLVNANHKSLSLDKLSRLIYFVQKKFSFTF